MPLDRNVRPAVWSTIILVGLLVLVTACAPVPTAVPAHSESESSSGNPGNEEVESSATALPAESSTASVPTTVPSPTPALAARVNGQPIYQADYERQLARYQASLAAQGIDPNSPEGQQKVAQQREWILNMMIEQVLTEQAAEAADLVVSDQEVDAYMESLIAEYGGREAFEARLAEVGDTYESAWREVRAELIGSAMTQYIAESVPTVAEHVHARHILVDTQEEAERILAQLQAGADFGELARMYSQDASTRENGGDLGFFPRGVLVAPEVEDAAFALQPGQFSGVIPSVLGYHIVQVVERDPARPVNQQNLDMLKNRKIQEWIETMWAQAQIERFVETAP